MSPLSGMGCPVGTEGPSGQVKRESPTLAPAPLITTPYPRSTVVASPSRESDSRMVLQVEAISEMDCHSSSRVSLPASDMTVGSGGGFSQGSAGQAPSHSAPRTHPTLAPDSLLLIEFLRDKVRGKKEALSSGAGSSLSSKPPGLPGPSWGGGRKWV